MQQDINHSMYLFWPQWYKTRNRLQEKKKNLKKHTNTRRLSTMLLNNEWFNNETKEGIKRYLDTNENENNTKLKLQWDIISHLSEWLSSINQLITSAGEDVDKQEPFCTVGGNADWCSHCGKQYGDNSKKLKMDLPFDPVIPLLGIYLKEPKTLISKNLSSLIFIAVWFTIAKIWKQPKCPSVDEWIKLLQDIYTMEYYSTIKNKKILPFETVWMDLENIMLSEISQSEKDRYHMISLICGI